MATKSDIIAVKLASPSSRSFPRTSELMQAVDFVVKTAIRLGRPLALNLSFGNNYGSHTGTSLLETYLNDAALAGISSLIIGMGNEGIAAIHTSGVLSNGETSAIELSIAPYEPSLNLQIWKSYYDEIQIVLTSPTGSSVTIPSTGPAAYRYSLNQTEILVYYGEPGPFSTFQEIYFDFIPRNSYLDSGFWTISLTGKKIKNGEYQLWLPVSSSLNGSRFPVSSPYGTLTIPSTAGRGISVGAYNPYDFSVAAFSGRGYEDFSVFSAVQKPDLAAPGVDIVTAAVGGGFVTNSGTSMAAPFVTAAAAMLMEWGIVNENDPFLYGEKVKAYLINGAKPLPGFTKYPNPQAGWGALCVADSIPTR
jgi:subtilisin family serine protease